MDWIFEWRDAPRADFAVIGDPISHSWSPKMFRAAFESLGLDYRYVAIRVPLTEHTEALDHLKTMGYRGLNVTIPLKEVLSGLPINTIDLRNGQMISTDGPGLVAALRGKAQGKRLLLLGAGGAAGSVLKPLMDEGYEISIWNRTRGRIERLFTKLSLRVPILDVPDTNDFDLVVNGTPSSLVVEDSPVSWRGTGFAMDMMYMDQPTSFMRDAIGHGWQAEDGREMLVQQGALSFEFWLNQPAPIDIMRRALSES